MNCKNLKLILDVYKMVQRLYFICKIFVLNFREAFVAKVMSVFKKMSSEMNDFMNMD
jgi:hypothetical protein